MAYRSNCPDEVPKRGTPSNDEDTARLINRNQSGDITSNIPLEKQH